MMMMTMIPVGAELFHADGQKERQTDRYEETDNRFAQFW
jgi:hypothetical protein